MNRRTRSQRQFLLRVLMITISVLLVGRVAMLQVLDQNSLAQQAQAEHMSQHPIVPARGVIYDDRGAVLAAYTVKNTVEASRDQIPDAQVKNMAQHLAALLNLPEPALEKRLGKATGTIVVDTAISDDVTRKISALKLPGVFMQPEATRVYPGGSLAGAVLGFSAADGTGYYGLEEAYNRIVGGQQGNLVTEIDDNGQGLAFGARKYVPPVPGASLHLTLDAAIQQMAEDELAKTITKYKAARGDIVIMDTRTGGIMAMASWPPFDPNNYKQIANSGNVSLFKDPAISNAYEPGSVMKIVTVAAALDQGIVTPQTTVPDEGTERIDGTIIHNWDYKPHANETMTVLFRYSANVGAATVADRMGASRFYPYLRKFGLGKPTGVDLTGETGGIVNWPGGGNWYTSTLLTNAYGQGIAVTPLQMVTAVNAVANDGVLMQPYLVDSISTDQSSGAIPPGLLPRGQVGPRTGRRIISSLTARTETKMLVESAKDGEAKSALVSGYTIAAKTGTAQVPDPRGGYSPTKTIASLVGWAPAYNPRFTMLVKIDAPTVSAGWGTVVAGPAWQELATWLFQYLNVPPQ